MKPTRVWDVVGLFAVAAVVGYLLIGISYSSLPPISPFAAASLLPVALIEVVIAFLIRSRINNHEVGDGPRQLHPIIAARAAALAKASALVGSAGAGIWLGFAMWVFPRRSTVRAAGADSPGIVVGLIAGTALVVAAMWLEHCCKTPPEPPEGSAG